MCFKPAMPFLLIMLALLVACTQCAAFGDSMEEGLRDKKIFTILRRNNSCKMYGHSCLGGHGKRSEEGTVSSDVMQMLRKSAAEDDAGAMLAQARLDRPALLEKTLLQILRNRLQ
ncbi:uncharacterized protein LOC8039983 isoform X1 [Ixodes scapularis]|nr:uncharacterized protein LOC8039983 isoform X1 [Ixodes scapularis]